MKHTHIKCNVFLYSVARFMFILFVISDTPN